MDKPVVIVSQGLIMPAWQVPEMKPGEDAEHFVRRGLADGVGYAVACWAVRGEGMLEYNASALAMTLGDWVKELVEAAYIGGARVHVQEIANAYGNGVHDGAAFARRGMEGE